MHAALRSQKSLRIKRRDLIGRSSGMAGSDKYLAELVKFPERLNTGLELRDQPSME